jgi:hypothetical protein
MSRRSNLSVVRDHEARNPVGGIKARRTAAPKAVEQLRLSGSISTEARGPHAMPLDKSVDRLDQLLCGG